MVLGEGESVIWYGRRSALSLMGLIVPGVLITLLGIFAASIDAVAMLFLSTFGLILLVVAFLILWQTEYVITNRRVYSKVGILSRRATDASFEKITDASISQNFGGRMLGYGDVRINTAGTQTYEICFEGVPAPTVVRSKIQSISRRSDQERDIQKRIERFEDRYLAGEISREQFERAEKNLRNRV
jgi:uncharacterized membrane protein YdbT with pleckstrin-like domain